MGTKPTKNINQDFFKTWAPEMAYILGYIVADGCIVERKDRKKNPFTLNITSVDKNHLSKLKKALKSEHKIGKKASGSTNGMGYQLQICNSIIAKGLINLGISPRKTYNLNPIKTPEKYFNDFVRGFFDGDGSVFIYRVNRTPQIKANFASASFSFINDFNQRLCGNLKIPFKNVHRSLGRDKRMALYSICFYVDDCEKLADFMYKDNPSLYLPRKYQIFEKWKSVKRRNYIKHSYPSKVGWQLNQKVFS